MDSDKKKLKVILLVIVGVAIAVLAFIYAYSQLFGSSDLPTTNEQYATFPDSGIREIPNEAIVDDVSQVPTSQVPTLAPAPVQLENNSFQSETDWRDEIVYPEPSVTKTSATQPATATEVESEIDALYAAAEELSRYKPDFYDSQSFIVVPVLDQSSANDCGTVNVPSTVSAQERMISGLEDNDSAICMGEAVADDCAVAKTVITGGDISQILIVAERTDGVCGIGTSYDDNFVNLCSIEDVMNAMTGENNDISEWKNIFAAEPGETFAQLYIGSSEGITKAVTANKLDCKTFEL